MPWSLAGVTIHPDGGEDVQVVEANYAIQEILDATVNTITFLGANSDRRTLSFILDETEAAGGLNTLKTSVRTDANVNLTSDQGSQGNYRILSLEATRLQALNKASPVYKCVAELIKP
jgi:hypothetical protein